MSAHRIDQMLAAWFGVKDKGGEPAERSQEQGLAELMAMMPQSKAERILTPQEYLDGTDGK